MSATLVPFDGQHPVSPNAHAERQLAAFRAAHDALLGYVRGAGLDAGPDSPVRTIFMVGLRLTRAWESRARRLEQQLRSALACDGLTDERRTGILQGLYGRGQAAGHDAKLLSDLERQLVEHYRAMDPAGRQMLRTLCARLAASPRAEVER